MIQLKLNSPSILIQKNNVSKKLNFTFIYFSKTIKSKKTKFIIRANETAK